MSPLTLLRRIPAGFWALVVCASVIVGAYRHWQSVEQAKGALRVRLATADSALHADSARVKASDTVRVTVTRRFVVRDSLWQHDTVRVAILAEPDTAVVPVREYRRLATNDSLVLRDAKVVIAADSVVIADARALLRTTNAKLKLLSDAHPIISYEPSKLHRVGDWVTRTALVVSLAYNVHQATR